MEMTRFRRYLRNHYSDTSTEAQDLLDMIDQTYEAAEQLERKLATSEDLEDREIYTFLNDSASRMLVGLLELRGMQADPIHFMINRYGYNSVAQALENLAPNQEDAEEWDDHPF